MKLIVWDFIFWFKMGNLIIYLVTDAWVSYLQDSPIYYISAYVLAEAVFFTLCMLTDALNISQRSKLLLISFALASFAYNSLKYQQASLYQYDIFQEANVSLSVHLPLHVNLIQIPCNAAEI